ncbi:MAG: tRNA (uridine(34)/cytosine(34)/5-carboxymethylaminomethyluridine(34)-2'-O)-methyltransferase TrmL [Pseudomonadales bacterium]
MISIALYEPEIPPNTGNIIRLCANTGAQLYLIEPLGFQLDDRRLRRAGLDYHEWANVQTFGSLEKLLRNQQFGRVFGVTTKGEVAYTDVRYQTDDLLLFGPETRGLPDTIRQALPDDHLLRIPMQPTSRSLNLANAVSILVYEAWRQHKFAGAC